MATRKGRQTPTRSLVLPYRRTKGSEAVRLYTLTGHKLMTWQQSMLRDMMAVNRSGLWVHAKWGYSLPRRNGKSEILAARELWGLISGEHIMHTAHRTSTTHAAWELLASYVELTGVPFRSIRATGREIIEISRTGGRVEYRTRTTSGGLGEGYDLLIIDEAQEYTEAQDSALKYIVTSSKNPQTIYTGTPPTSTSVGTVFPKLRAKTLRGETEDGGWAEWGVEVEMDPRDKEAWYETNPSLGTVFSERNVAEEIGPDKIDFNIQRLGLWYKSNLKSAISKADWISLQVDTLPQLVGPMYVGIKFGRDDPQNAAMAIAIRTEQGQVFVEAIDCRPMRVGMDWIMTFLTKAEAAQVVADGASGQQMLADAMKAAGLRKPKLPTVKEVIAANAEFEQVIADETIVHMEQPSLERVVTNCEHRPIGSSGGYGFRAIVDGADIALMDAAIYAVWACLTAKPKRKQEIDY